MVIKMNQVYDPNWNPDEYDMTLKYECVHPSRVNDILVKYKREPVLDYIKELFKLIDYQKNVIAEQRKFIIAVKHKEAWKRYDLPESKFQPSVDKPAKSGNMSC